MKGQGHGHSPTTIQMLRILSSLSAVSAPLARLCLSALHARHDMHMLCVWSSMCFVLCARRARSRV
jgi:hypothetical protein